MDAYNPSTGEIIAGSMSVGPATMSATTDKIFAAIAKAQVALQPAYASRKNDAFKRDGKASKYADLADVWEVVQRAFSPNGLAVLQAPMVNGSEVSIQTIIGHESGQWMCSTICAKAADASPQKIGSAVTYLRRYGLCAMTGVVADDDDDGNSNMSRPRDSAPATEVNRSTASPKVKDEEEEKLRAEYTRIRRALREATTQEGADTIWEREKAVVARIRNLSEQAFEDIQKSYRDALEAAVKKEAA